MRNVYPPNLSEHPPHPVGCMHARTHTHTQTQTQVMHARTQICLQVKLSRSVGLQHQDKINDYDSVVMNTLVMCVTQSADCYCIHLWKALNISSCCKAYSVNNTIILAPGSSICDPFVFLEFLLNFVYFAVTITLSILLTSPLSEHYPPVCLPDAKHSATMIITNVFIYVTSGRVSDIHLSSR